MADRPIISREAAALSILSERQPRPVVRRLLRAHGDAVAILAAEDQDHEGAIRRRIRDCEGCGAGIVCESDPEFPTLLACIPDAPLMVHYRGSLGSLGEADAEPAVAVVGARRATRFGREFATLLGTDLAGEGFTVVSGLALGIDAAAHRGALSAPGRTLAVLGSGIDRAGPASNMMLALAILRAGGALLSEYPPGTPAAPFRFPERNRLISGLALGVVVVEASARSGSLITARLAGEQGRDVMAVPGAPGLPNSAGCNGLLKVGAALVEKAGDVLEMLGFGTPGTALGTGASPTGLNPTLARLLDFIGSSARGVDELAQSAQLGSADCVAALAELELGGFVQRVADGYIRRPSGL